MKTKKTKLTYKDVRTVYMGPPWEEDPRWRISPKKNEVYGLDREELLLTKTAAAKLMALQDARDRAEKKLSRFACRVFEDQVAGWVTPAWMK